MKSLIVYFSHSGTTRRLAELIAKETGGDLLELVPEIAYPRDYSTVVAQAKRELQSGYRPALKTASPNLSAYDMVFVGTPNWWSSPAPPVLTFLEQAGYRSLHSAHTVAAVLATFVVIWKKPATAQYFCLNCPFMVTLEERLTFRSG